MSLDSRSCVQFVFSILRVGELCSGMAKRAGKSTWKIIQDIQQVSCLNMQCHSLHMQEWGINGANSGQKKKKSRYDKRKR